MEFIPRGETRPAAPAAHTAGGRQKHLDWNGRAVRIEWFIFTSLVALVLLIAIGWLIFSNNGSNNGESGQIDKSKYQAVFLNGGATSGSVAYTTYFGHVTKLNSSYMILKDVYYLTTSSTDNNQSANPQLTKLGCQQLHSPYDEMVINRNQVAFWENLQDNGKVVQAIKTFQQQNPNGPNCSSSSNSTNSTTNTQTTTPTTNSTTNSNTNRTNP
ncbi:MAG TPA: hypothetical protein VFH37_00635 [Candidatus Saccharimonadales bacterium]|nr:hypothetical protein [Candidatus Saccharimonadales bacterium]